MALCQTSVLRVYQAVIEDVIANVRDAFLDEGVDEQVLQEMKQIWRTKLLASKAVELNPTPVEPTPPPIVANNPKPTKAAAAKAKKAAAAAAAQQNGCVPNMNTTNGLIGSGQNGTIIKQENILEQHSQQHPQQSSSGGHIHGGSNPTIIGSTTILQQKPSHQPQHVQQVHQQPPPQQQQQQQHQQSSSTSSTIPIVAALDPNRIMPVNITLPAQPGTINSESRVLTIQVPASALQENQLTQILTANLIQSIMSLPTTLACSVLQQHVNAALSNANMQRNSLNISKQLDGVTESPLAFSIQVDGALDSSEDDESEESENDIDNDDDDIDKDDDDDDIDNEGAAEEEPLNSGDDVSDEESTDLFDTDNVIVCQYDKITRSRNKWKFYLKDGIMNINGKDYVFQKSNGDAEW